MKPLDERTVFCQGIGTLLLHRSPFPGTFISWTDPREDTGSHPEVHYPEREPVALQCSSVILIKVSLCVTSLRTAGDLYLLSLFLLCR